MGANAAPMACSEPTAVRMHLLLLARTLRNCFSDVAPLTKLIGKSDDEFY